MKWPIETMYVGMKLEDYVSNVDAVRRRNLDKWYKFSEVVESTYYDTGFECYKKEILTGTNSLVLNDGVTISVTPNTVGQLVGVGTDFDGSVSGGAQEIFAGDFIVVMGIPYYVTAVQSATVLQLGAANQPLPFDDVALTTDFYKYTRVPKSSTVTRDVPTLDSISVTAHGIPIYNDFPNMFFNSYQSYQYGGPNINTPTDVGALMINFCLYPGTYQPSGHINISRAREFYIQYASSVISSNVRGVLVVVAVAINFLLISDGSAVLRYST